MLSAVERCVEHDLAQLRGERIDLSRIPYDDPATYECIQTRIRRASSRSRAARRWQSLRRTRPENLQDITIQVAIVRPGPIQGGAVNPYIERSSGCGRCRTFRSLRASVLEPVLPETLGTIIFQDQVLEVAIAFAGFSDRGGRGAAPGDEPQTLGRGDRGLTTSGSWPAPSAQARGRARTSPSGCSTMVQGFSGFGFPKAHGAAFGLLAYQSTWLRVHYAPEFLCSLLNEQPMGFYPPDALVHEAQRRGIEVLAPDVNESGVECDVVLEPSPRVRIGLGYVRGVRERSSSAGRRAREEGGRFRSLSDLASRGPGGGRCRRCELLAWSGACDSLVGGRAGARGAGGRGWRQRRIEGPPSRGGSRCGSSGSPRRPGRERARAGVRSWRSRLTSLRRRRCASSRTGSRCSPTTAPPG